MPYLNKTIKNAIILIISKKNFIGWLTSKSLRASSNCSHMLLSGEPGAGVIIPGVSESIGAPELHFDYK